MQEESKEFILESLIPDEVTEMKILGIEEFAQAEWVFQFDDDEPVVIAWSNDPSTPGELSFVLKANSGSNLVFASSDGEKTLRLFSREMSDATRERLNNQNEIKDGTNNTPEIN